MPVRNKKNFGFTLIELLVTIGVFSMLVVAFISVAAALSRSVKAAREKTVLSSLASQYLEIVRNLPYSQVGTVHGVPAGSLPDFAAPYVATINGTTYQIYYEVTWVDDPADGTALAGTDSVPTDYKQVKMDILNTTTSQVTNFVTTVVPQGLEGANNSGTLWIKVLNAVGQPVPDAQISIVGVSNGVNLMAKSDSTGQWIQYGLPPGVNAYHIAAAKAGYSTDQTYPITALNPNPVNPDVTINVGQVTQDTFAIDLLSNLSIRTVDQYCNAISGVPVNVVGAKLIGTSPNIPKFSQMFTSGPAAYPPGQINLNNIEWDTYTPSLASGSIYTLVGTSPVQDINVLPNTSETFTMYLSTTSTTNTLLVIVKDASSGAPLEGVSLELIKGGSLPQDYFGTSGGSVWAQTDWSGGSGFADWNPALPSTYYAAVGNIYVNTSNGSNDVELAKVGNRYPTNATSTLESSAFDSGSSSTQYTTLSWQPTSQAPNTFLGFQLASNNDDLTWNYVGPDGTANTYYTVPGTNINPVHNNNRYVRYKAYFETADNQKTPVLSSVLVNFVSGCFAPGQFFFDNLTPSSGNAYSITASLPGYQTQTINGIMIGGQQTIEILLSP
ncbi:MAG: carboxypeptidase regulatory-like domain-containing protein [Patescibacteria group bacterium]|nr:carboxypeptidase regulatory-like domain-containing protein [Patescibacteria group bacterium]